MDVRLRVARCSDAEALHELRRRSILELAIAGMSIERAQAWANKGSVEFMCRRLEEAEAWVAEDQLRILGWVAVRGDYLDALYVEPEYAGRGIGAHLLRLAEEKTLRKGIEVLRTEASPNSERFYLRQGYELLGPGPREEARPMWKRLAAEPAGAAHPRLQR